MTAEVLKTPVVVAQRAHRRIRCWQFWSISSKFRRRGGLVVIAVLVLLALFADVVAPHSRSSPTIRPFLKPPFWQQGGSTRLSARHRRDRPRYSVRLIHGARLSLLIGIAVVALSVVTGRSSVWSRVFSAA
jgi:dipeptide transport system permease protein